MNIKTLFRICAVGALLFTVLAPPARAQQYEVKALLNQGGTNNVGINSTNSWPMTGGTTNTIVATKHDEIGLAIKLEAMASSSALTELVFRHSLDGTTNYATVNPIRISLTHDGTTPVCFVTNITMAARGYLALDRITNGAVAITNMTIKYTLKPKRNG